MCAKRVDIPRRSLLAIGSESGSYYVTQWMGMGMLLEVEAYFPILCDVARPVERKELGKVWRREIDIPVVSLGYLLIYHRYPLKSVFGYLTAVVLTLFTWQGVQYL